jgi:hypothetical protein
MNTMSLHDNAQPGATCLELAGTDTALLMVLSGTEGE